MANIDEMKTSLSLSKPESQSKSDVMMICNENGDGAMNKSAKNRGIDCQYQQNSLGFLQGVSDDLKLEKILTLFDDCQENLEYFVGLWNFFNSTMTNENIISNEGESCLKHSCDPRDERKRQCIKNWEPDVIVCPVGFSDARGGMNSEFSSIGVNDVGGDGDVELPAGSYAAKQTVLDLDPVEDGFVRQEKSRQLEGITEQGDVQRFPCGVHGCGQVLFSLANFESHYRHCHSYVCDACRRVFVSNFLLDIHLQENHDSYFAVLSPRIDMFRCLVESCEQKFRTPELRKDHLVSVHKFPSSFSFHQPLKPNRSVKVENNMGTAMDVEVETTSSASMPPTKEGKSTWQSEGNSNSSQRKKIPASICFGRGSQRAFQHRRGRGGHGKGRNRFLKTDDFGAGDRSQSATDTNVDIESVDMKELADALT